MPEHLSFINSNSLYTSTDERHLYPLLSRFSLIEQRRILQQVLGINRSSRLDAVFANKLSGLHIAVEDPKDPHNAAAMVRSAESMGLLHIHAISKLPKVFHAKSTTQGSYHWMFAHYYNETEALYAYCKNNDIQLVACTMDADTTLQELKLTDNTCLIFGSERDGLSDYVLQNAHKRVCIPMYGLSESLNLSVSAAICMYSLTTKLRSDPKNPSIYASLEERTLLHVRALLKSRKLVFLEKLLCDYSKKANFP